MNICIVSGARPNFIKVAPILHVCRNARQNGADIDIKLVYAGSEDDVTLEPTLFTDLQIAPPDSYLGVVSENLNEITGQVMSKFEDYLQHHKTDAVIVMPCSASAANVP